MGRLIDADELKKRYAWWDEKGASEFFREFKHIFDMVIDKQPTANAIEVLRCKDCKHLKDGATCERLNITVLKNFFFCAECEEKDDGEA